VLFIEVLGAVAASVGVVIAGFGTGHALTRGRELSDWQPEKAALETLLGMGLNALALFLVGMWHWSIATVAAVLAAPFLLGLRGLVKAQWSLQFSFRSLNCVACAVLVICFLGGFAKPAGDIGNDTISYHLLGPKSWCEEGRIRPVLDHSHTAMPATVETLFGAGMVLSNDRAPGVIDSFFFALLLIQVAGLARKLGGSEKAVGLAVVLAATMPAIVDFSNNGFVDLAYACFVLASMRAVVWPSKGVGGDVLGGTFAGISIGTKYTGLIFAGIATLVRWLRLPGSGRWSGAVLFPIVAGLVGCAWYLRNWVVLGSPVYPIPAALGGIFHSPAFPAAAVAGFQEYILGRGKGVGPGLGYFLALPVTFTYFTAAFHGAGGIGLAPLGFAPLGIYEVRRERGLRSLIGICFMFTLAWFVTQQESRFLIPVVCVVAALAGVGAETALRQTARTKLLAWSILGISIVYGGLIILHDEWPRLTWLRGPTAELNRQKALVPYYSAFGYLNDTTEVRRVLILDKLVPTYYLSKPYVKILGPYGETPVPGVTSELEALRQSGSMGITNVLEVEPKATPMTEAGCGPLKIVFSSADARVYRCD
jgi:hypothetical protein